MSYCPHGVYLGVGCKKCPKMKGGAKLSKVRIHLMKTAILLAQKAEAEPVTTKKMAIEEDFHILMQMRARY